MHDGFPRIGENLVINTGTNTHVLITQVDIVLTPLATYNVDIVHAHSAEVMSAHS